MIDANGQRFWQLAAAADWQPTDRRVVFDANCRHLRLRDRRPRQAEDEGPVLAEAEARRTQPSRARDAFGSLAWWDGTSVQASGALRTVQPPLAPVTLWAPPSGTVVRDLALGFDDVLYIAAVEPDPVITARPMVRLLDRRQRWTDAVSLARPGFVPAKLAAHPGGGVWALDTDHKLLARIRGLPLTDVQRLAVEQFGDTTFRPRREDPDPLRIEAMQVPPWDAGDTVIGLACSPEGSLAILTWRNPDQSWLYVRRPDGRWQPARPMAGDSRPYSIAWLADDRLAALPAPRRVGGSAQAIREALVYSLDDKTEELEPVGEFYPLRRLGSGGWVQGVTLPPHYPVDDAEAAPLVALSGSRFERTGVARARVINSGAERPTWHRLNVEALIPPGCGFVVELAATEEADQEPPADAWFPHHFGATPSADPRIPRGARLSQGSELPLHAGLLGDDAADEYHGTLAGTFTVLIQRRGRRVGALRGRCLHVRVTLFGRGNATPRIYAVRAWAPRFSYRDRYLAELYREDVFGEAADQPGPATGADFLDRFLGLFEGVLTPLEDRVAAAHIVTDPSATPAEALDWLGSWVGETFEAGFPPERRRAWLAASSWLHRAHGTFSGLQLALELATGGQLVRRFSEDAGREVVFPTGGGVTGGEIVVVEEFRLRRTLATILGARLDLAEDPLLPGLIVSANSLVGDTLILGEEEKKEFLALFRNAFSANPTERATEVAAVTQLYERLAHRVTILVHQEIEPRDLGLIRRVAERMAPAHVVVTVQAASTPLRVGLASLVAVDTYLVPRPPREAAQVGVSELGGNSFVRRLPSLDPRLSGRSDATLAAPPRAQIVAPAQAEHGSDVTLDGSASSAAPGLRLTKFDWGWTPPP